MPCLFCGNLEAPGIFKPHHGCQLSDSEPCAACKEVQELEPQIAEAKDVLYKMLVRHRELRTKMNHSHNPIVSQLPPEIVSHIFELSLPERPPEKSSRGLTKNEICAPLILGAACQLWRHIAFSTPQIWTSISIYLGNRFESAKAGTTQCELAQEWLSRSGELPLSVYIYGGTEHTGGRNIASLMEIVNRHSSRWNHLELEFPQHLASLLCGDSSGASILHNLRLYCNDESEYRFLDEGSFTLSNVKPSPTSISLANWSLKKVNIEWNHATHVNLGWADISECIEVLRCAPQLICFKFTEARDRISTDFSPYATPASPIIRPLLRELEIGVDDADMGAKFADSFILAGLEILTFSGHDSLPTNSLISLLNRSSCLLTTLSIKKYSINNAEILPLLRATPSVRNLHFCWLFGTIAFFNPLETISLASSDKPEEDGHLLPGLETISFSGEHRTAELFPWSLVSKMFGPVSEIHSTHRRPLSKFDISLTQYGELSPSLYIDEESIRRFLELREAGITLDFTIVVHTEARDLIELSIEHHGKIDKPSPSSNSSS
ncbi:hypothetical protein BDZ97DRAFT_1753055 [Flammula alnicola]|nr:hypothetical protein BDZ97DRAFT_1753055 [Flammula alnicola]